MHPAQRGRLRRLTADCTRRSIVGLQPSSAARSAVGCFLQEHLLRHLQDDLGALHRVVLHPIDLRRGNVDIAGKQSSAVDPDIADAKQSVRERRRTFGLAPSSWPLVAPPPTHPVRIAQPLLRTPSVD
jgi:hypothetical protein